jgi:signal transduction histidine kinase
VLELENLVDRLLNCGWDPDKTDPVQMRRIRTTAATSLLLILVGIPFLLRAYEWHISLRMITVPAAILLSCCALVTLRVAKNFPISTQLVTLAVYVGGAGAILTSGGIGTSTLGWWMLVPLLAGLLRGLSSGLGWGVVVLMSIYACYWAQMNGIQFIDQTPLQHRLSQSLMQGLGITSAVLIFIGSYVSQIAHSERELAQHNKMLHAEVERAEQAERDLISAIHAKTRFLSNMSHELKTPLNSVLGFSQRLNKRALEKLDQREQDALGEVVSHAQQMLNLVNDLLDLSQLDSEGRLHAEKSQLDLKELLVRVRHEIQPVAQEFGLTVCLQETDSLIIQGDGRLLSKALASLLRHCVMYAQGDDIQLQIGELQQGVLVQMHYIGYLSEADRNRLFDRYNHLHSKSTRQAGNSGLALALAAELVSLHGGRISVSCDEQGPQTCLNVFLPV